MTKRTQAILDLEKNEKRRGAAMVKGQINKAVGNLRRAKIFGAIPYGSILTIGGVEVKYEWLAVKNFMELLIATHPNNYYVKRAHEEINFNSTTSPILYIDGKAS